MYRAHARPSFGSYFAVARPFQSLRQWPKQTDMGPHTCIVKCYFRPIRCIRSAAILGPSGVCRNHRYILTWVLPSTTPDMCYMGSPDTLTLALTPPSSSQHPHPHSDTLTLTLILTPSPSPSFQHPHPYPLTLSYKYCHDVRVRVRSNLKDVGDLLYKVYQEVYSKS
jgi:hypothetical protein